MQNRSDFPQPLNFFQDRWVTFIGENLPKSHRGCRAFRLTVSTAIDKCPNMDKDSVHQTLENFACHLKDHVSGPDGPFLRMVAVVQKFELNWFSSLVFDVPRWV